MSLRSTSCAAILLAVALPGARAASVPATPDQVLASVEPAAAVAGSRLRSLDELIPDPQIIDRVVLAGIDADPGLVGEPGRKVLDLVEQLDRAERTRSWAIAEINRRSAAIRMAEHDEVRARRASHEAAERRQEAQQRLETFGVEAFLAGSARPHVADLFGAAPDQVGSAATRALRGNVLSGAGGAELARRLEERRVREADRLREHTAVVDRLARQRRLLDDAVLALSTSSTAIADLAPRVAGARRRLEEHIALAPLPETRHLTVVAVDAYYNASRIAARRWPECRLRWYQLAGVGHVESAHGTIGPSRLDHRGNTEPRILGPPLSGGRWLAVEDTDGGRLDGDPEWDRAVGPMQFIPSSWVIYAADGNGDGVADPDSLYDAAVAAADHLCGVALDQPTRFGDALLGYNRSRTYAAEVRRLSDEYADVVDLVDPWDLDSLEVTSR